MKLISIEVDFSDYVELYTEIAYHIASCRASGARVIALVPKPTAGSESRFYSYVKKILLTFKRQGTILTYIKFSELHEDKTASKYLLNLFPFLENEIVTDKCGFIVKL